MIVADASVLAPVVADHGSDGANFRRRLRGEIVAVPDLARIEVISVIRRQLHSGTLDSSQAVQAVDDLLELPLVVCSTARLLRYPYLERADVLAALKYATAAVNEREVPIARPA